MKVIDRKFFLDNLKAYDTNVVQKALSNIETTTVDSTLSELSTNAIQNKAVATAINNEIGERESADEVLQGQITANTNAINTLNGTGVGSVTKTVADKISEVIANAPADFDTLKEISDWISTHENSASSMNTAINKNATNLSNHIANKSNPHGVTKAQIGLENVANYNQSKAIVSISRSGTTFTATHLDGTTSTFTQQDNNTTYSNATTKTAGLMSAADKTKLDGVAAGANNYTHPTTSGNKHIPSGGSSGQILRWASDGTATWGADNNTTYSNATTKTAGLMSAADKTKLDGLTTYSNATTSAAGLMSSADKTKLDGVAAGANNYTHPTTSGNKHIPSGGSSGQILRWSADGTAVWGNDNNTTYSNATTSTAGLMSSADKTKLDGIATGANNYTHPTTSGNKHIPSGGSSGQILRWASDGTAVWGADNNTTYSNFKAASASAAGSSGLVPAPAAGANTKYLRGDGTWATPISISVSGNTATITY